MIRRTLLLEIAAALAIATTAAAQDPCPTCIDAVSGEFHILPAVGIRAGIPQKLSAAIGIVAGRNYRESGRTRDVAVYAEPGLSAGRASLAFLSSGYGNTGAGWGFAATALRTWKDPVNFRTNQTFAGGEVWVWPAFFSGPRLGVFREMTGSRHGWYLAADFGFGL
jgi:hypothetical protein